MPSRTQNLQDESEYMDLMSSTCYDSTKAPFFIDNNNNNNFENDVDMWQDWMRWDGGAADFCTPSSTQKQDTSSSIWSTETPETEQTPLRQSNLDGFLFGDCQFDPEESTMEMSFETPSNQSLSGIPTSQDYPVLTEAEVQALQAIAMPFRMFSEDKTNNMTATVTESSLSRSTSPEPQSRARKNKKRKSVVDDGAPADLCQSRKRGHNAIEKRYRTNLNAKIDCLRQGVPSLCGADAKSGDEVDDDSDAEGNGKGSQQKYGKAAILTRALDYIKHLETTTTRLGGDVDSLKLRVGAFEKLAMSGSTLSSSNIPSSHGEVEIKSETLESIQADFQQIKPHRKTSSANSPATRKKTVKQAKK